MLDAEERHLLESGANDYYGDMKNHHKSDTDDCQQHVCASKLGRR